MNQDEVEKRLEGLEPDKAKAVVCALIGHSRIVETCFGYIHCARCGAQVGDSLGGSGSTKDSVIVAHDCEVCRANFAKCDWRDTFMTSDPFDPVKIQEMKDARVALDKFLAEKRK